ncbi:MAG: ATP phosphoribosyltransferase [Nannocystaceae bacterium]
MGRRLTFALPKGRIIKDAAPILEAAGISLEGVAQKGDRRLEFEIGEDYRVLLVKPTDVPTYVGHGVADFGIVGRDTLEEQSRDLYEPIDLEIGRCRMCVAEPRTAPARATAGTLIKVATKYPTVAERHYRAKGVETEIIPLFGSVELGCLTSLADQIVDIVESGETLRQNDLVEVETIFSVSSRLVVSPASLKVDRIRIRDIIEAIREAVIARRKVRRSAR